MPAQTPYADGDMRKSILMRFLIVALLSSAAWAQNFDMFVAAGPAWTKSQVIGGSNVRLASSRGVSSQINYGFQVARMSAASLMLDFSQVFSYPGEIKASVPASGSNSFSAVTLGLRFMVPVHSRLSFYPVAGGGFGSFRSPVVTGGAIPSVSKQTTIHGLFAFGGGVDVRLSQRFSIRVEVKDMVTGRELSGAAGRHHVLPLFGVAFHR